MFEALLLGIVQGLTEFLPVSSSAHLRIVGEFIGHGDDPGAAFTAITQLGTEAAVLVYFRRDLGRIIRAWWLSLIGRLPRRTPLRRNPDALLGWYIILGSLPIVALGILFEEQIETTLRSLWIIAFTFIGFGILLGLADWFGRRQHTLDRLTPGHAIAYGLAQALALIPGVSRSGGTITLGLALGYTREAAARYSFLLAVPAVIGSGGFQLIKTTLNPCTDPGTGAAAACVPEIFTGLETALATVTAFGVALLVITIFMNYIARHSFLPFVIYRVALGGAIIVLLTTGVLQP